MKYIKLFENSHTKKELNTKKVIDHTSIPDNILQYLSTLYENIPSNVWVDYEVGISSENEYGKNLTNKLTILDEWLYDNYNVHQLEVILIKIY